MNNVEGEDYVSLYAEIRDCYYELEKYEEAHRIWSDLYQKYQTIFGKHHNKTLMVYFRLGEYFFKNEEYERAREMIESSYGMLCAKDAFDEAQKLYAAWILMICCRELEDFEGLQDYTQELLAILSQDLKQYEEKYWYVYELLGDACRELGDVSKALDIHNEILKHWEETEDIPTILSARLSVSIDLEATGDFKKVYEFDKLSYDLVVEFYGEDSKEAKDYAGYLEDDLEAMNPSATAE